jgi:hypothetical protein
MELSGILTFFGVFIAILSVLVGIAYYGIKDVSYEDRIKSTDEPKTGSKANKKPKATKPKRDETQQLQPSPTKNKQQHKKRDKSLTSSQEQSTEEEEPIVIIPDPFTNKLSSRFAGATSSNNAKQSQTNRAVVSTNESNTVNNTKRLNDTNSSIVTQVLPQTRLQQLQQQQQHMSKPLSNQNQKVEKPRATVKPNQAIAVVTASPATQSTDFVKQQLKSLTAESFKTIPQISHNDSGLDVTRQLHKKVDQLNHQLTEKNNEIEHLKSVRLELKTEITK